jgi:hypothetical protein
MIIADIGNLSYMKFFKYILKKITLNITSISACLQPFLGYEEASSSLKDLKKAADLVYGLCLGWGFGLEIDSF